MVSTARILITGMGSTTAISVAKALRSQKELTCRITGVDINTAEEIAGAKFCDSFFQIPKARDPEYVSALLDIVRKNSIQVVFPIVDIELEKISERISDFRAAGAIVWVSDLETVRTCNDKYRTYCFFRQEGFPTADTWRPEEVLEKADRMAFPLIVKPVDGVSSIDVFRVDSPDELKAKISLIRNPLVQEYLKGREYTIDVICDAESRLLASVPRERIETKAGISTKGRTVRHEGMISLAGQIAQRLRICGPANIQCRVDESGEPRFFEINPRFSGTTPLTVAAGVNGPLILTRLALGLDAGQHYFDFKNNVSMARYWEEVFFYGD